MSTAKAVLILFTIYSTTFQLPRIFNSLSNISNRALNNPNSFIF